MKKNENVDVVTKKSQKEWFKNLLFKLRAQEEMVGFGLIIAIVAIILLVFLWFSLSKPVKDNLENYEVQSFIKAFLQYTTECENAYGKLDVAELILFCEDENRCEDDSYSCNVLNDTLEGIVDKSWQANGAIKGYNLKISVRGRDIALFDKGDQTSNSKGYLEMLPGKINITFVAYY